MGVGVDEPGGDDHIRCVDHLVRVPGVESFGDIGDFAVFNENGHVGQYGSEPGFEGSCEYGFHSLVPPWWYELNQWFLSPALYIMKQPAGNSRFIKKRMKNLIYADQEKCYRMERSRRDTPCRRMGLSG